MTSAEALEPVRGYATADRIILSKHAFDEMVAAGATRRDVRAALRHSHSCAACDKPGRWKVMGPDVDGDELTCVVVIESGVVVVTVW